MDIINSIKNVDIDDLARELEENASKKVCHPGQEEAKSLIGRFKGGDRRAFNELVDRNQKLVMSIAHHYTSDPEFLKDLVQEGNLGLIRSIEKFEPHFNVKFSTYASIWIRSNIEAHISKTTYNMKIPQNSRKLASKIFKIYDRLQGKEIPQHEILTQVAEEAGLKREDVRNLIALRSANVRMQDKRSSQVEGGDTLQDTIESDLCTEDLAGHNQVRKVVEALVDQLPEKQKEAVSFFYGTSSHPQCESFSEVARYMGITREYARILYNKGMKTLSELAVSQDMERKKMTA